jgi:hypothetical protein
VSSNSLSELKRVNCPSTALSHHIPDLTVFEDVVHLLSLLNVVILGEIIYPPFYDGSMEQYNPPKEYLFAIGREKAAGLLSHLSKALNLLKDGQSVGLKALFYPFFVQQVLCLVKHHYKCSITHGMPAGGSAACTTQKLCEVLAASFSEKGWFIEELRRQKDSCNTTYAWSSQEKYSMGIEKEEDGLGAGAHPSGRILYPFHPCNRSCTGDDFDIDLPKELIYRDRDETMSALFRVLSEGML